MHKLVVLGNRGFWNFRIKKGWSVNPELLPIPATEENLDVTLCALRFTHFSSGFVFSPASFSGCEYKWRSEASSQSGQSCL